MAINPIPQNPIGESFVWREWFQKLSDQVFGSLGNQNSNAVAITGGSLSNVRITGGDISNVKIVQSFVDNSPMGLQVPAAGSFTQLTTQSFGVVGTTNGQLLIGRTSDNRFVSATLTAGAGVSISNGAGSITISQSISNRYYGSFYDTTTQSAANISTAYAISFNNTDLSSGVSRGSPTSRITVVNAGIYNFQFSLRLSKATSGTGNVFVWADVGGTSVAYSARQITLAGSGADVIASFNFMISMSANTYFRLIWSTDNTDCTINATSAASPVPVIPSAMLSVQQV